MIRDQPILSFCMTCRDGHEAVHKGVRGGVRLAQAFLSAHGAGARHQGFALRGMQCMSQCKRPCVASLSGNGRFSYIFGDLDAAPSHIQALNELISLYLASPEGFLRRSERPEPLRARILGRLPPPGSASDLVIPYETIVAHAANTVRN